MKSFDAIVIGAGQAGPPLADRLTGAGQTVALVERKLLGGTCVNVGCTPTKTQVASAYAAHLARRAADYGVGIDGAVRVDMAKIKARSDTVVRNSRSGVAKWLAGMKGLTLVEGHARFEAPDRVRVLPGILALPVPLRNPLPIPIVGTCFRGPWLFERNPQCCSRLAAHHLSASFRAGAECGHHPSSRRGFAPSACTVSAMRRIEKVPAIVDFRSGYRSCTTAAASCDFKPVPF